MACRSPSRPTRTCCRWTARRSRRLSSKRAMRTASRRPTFHSASRSSSDGQAVDFGSMSARTLVTGGNGRASVTYTAPTSAGGASSQSESERRRRPGPTHRLQVRRRRLPSGSFHRASSPSDPRRVSRSSAAIPRRLRGPVRRNRRRQRGSGRDHLLRVGLRRRHQRHGRDRRRIATAPGYVPGSLTVTDNNGLSNQSAAQPVTVGAGAAPTADFVFSPTVPERWTRPSSSTARSRRPARAIGSCDTTGTSAPARRKIGRDDHRRPTTTAGQLQRRADGHRRSGTDRPSRQGRHGGVSASRGRASRSRRPNPGPGAVRQLQCQRLDAVHWRDHHAYTNGTSATAERRTGTNTTASHTFAAAATYTVTPDDHRQRWARRRSRAQTLTVE